MNSVIFIVITSLAVLSLMINVLLVLYIRHVMKRSALVVGATNDILGALEDFLTHLDNVNELPLFYGDETLAALLEHSKLIVEDVKRYRDGFVFEGETRYDNEPTQEATTEEE